MFRNPGGYPWRIAMVAAMALGALAAPAARGAGIEREMRVAQEKLYLSGLKSYSPDAKRSGLAVRPAPPRKATSSASRPAVAPATRAADVSLELARLKTEVASLKEALGVQEELATASEREAPRLQITSWLDLDFAHETRKGRPASFDAEHVYYIFSSQVSPEWKAYSEIEFERGAELKGGGGGDGEILVEQAWANYNRSPYLGLRLGKFLTPYGVWNRNHWDPITETSAQPFTFRNALIPVNQTGVSASGSVQRGRAEIDYVGFVTNGRGAKPHADDANGNKAVGFDLSAGKPRRWKVGLSAYRNKNDADGDRLENIGVLWWTFDRGRWHAQAEWLRHGGDRSIDAFYLQPSYRLDRNWKLVGRLDTWDPDRTSPASLRQTELLLGVNRRFADSVLGKLELIRHEDDAPGGASYNRIGTSLSILF
ncbi:MAG: hypothetical protein HYY25_13755 [Candidatus Wallbacteria bacterium]|nr:hypothetical protein [Candidatus Wallbacteria bacterium]MBI4865796.1 hypothetical protein [Candidatus Wallbacteria bacterium]